MKKLFFVAMITALTGIAVFAQDWEDEPEQAPQKKPIEIHLNYFVGSFGVHVYQFGAEGSVQLFNLGVEHAPSGVGFTFSPFNAFGWLGARSPEDSETTYFAMDGGANLINVSLYWDVSAVIIPDNEKLFFGPFAELNWLFFPYQTSKTNSLDVERLRFFGGFQYGTRRGDKLKFTPFTVEMGGCLDYNPNPSQAVKAFIYSATQDWKFAIRIKFGR